MKTYISNKYFLFYLLKFIGIFCLLYFGTLAVIGLSAPEGYYSPFIAHYLNYIDWLRSSILAVSKMLLSSIGYHMLQHDKYDLYVMDGKGIRMVYSCVGYGVMSFWGAFVLANQGNWIKKIKWLLFGCLVIWIINIFRITLLIIALNKNWPMPLGWDHHTWFNIAAYLLIFILIYFYDRKGRGKL